MDYTTIVVVFTIITLLLGGVRSIVTYRAYMNDFKSLMNTPLPKKIDKPYNSYDQPMDIWENYPRDFKSFIADMPQPPIWERRY